jgi:hypothetical protein
LRFLPVLWFISAMPTVTDLPVIDLPVVDLPVIDLP